MAVKKATTSDDLTQKGDGDVAQNEQQVANAEQAEKVQELTDPAVVADVEQPKTVKVKSPLGQVSEVPESILDALLDSGYSKN